MRKGKYNYFDDEPVESTSKEEMNKMMEHFERIRERSKNEIDAEIRHEKKKKSSVQRIMGFFKSLLLGLLLLVTNTYKSIRDDIDTTAKQAKLDELKEEFESELEANGESQQEAEREAELAFAEEEEKLTHKGRMSPWLRAIIVFIVTVVLIVAIIVTAVMKSTNAVNNRHSEFEKDATKVCTEYSEKYGIANYKYMSEYNVKGYMLTGLCVVRELDFDGNGKSELLLVYNNDDEYYEEVWGYSNGDFKQLYHQKVPQSSNRNDDVFVTIYSTDNGYYIAEHSSDNLSSVTLYRLAGNEFKKKTTAKYNQNDFTFTVKAHDETDSFERIKLTVLRESAASIIVDRTLSASDSYNEQTTQKPVANSGTANSAFYEIVKQYITKYGEPTLVTTGKMPCISGLAGVSLVDFDGDAQEELMLVYQKSISERDEDSDGNYISTEHEQYCCEIYKWNGHNAIQVYQDESIGNLYNDEASAYYILKKDGSRVFYCTNKFKSSDYGRTASAVSKMMRFTGDRFEQQFKASYETEYGYTKYYIDGEREYKNSFEENGGYKVPFFNGENEFDNTSWQVCFMKGESKWEPNIRTQYDKTKDTIKILQTK